MARKYASLMLIPEDGRQLRQVRVPLWPLYSLAVIIVVIIAVVVTSGFAINELVSTRKDMTQLQLENQTLRSDLVSLGSTIIDLDQTVNEHLHLANESRLLAGLPPYSEDVGRLGVGGSPPPAAPGPSGETSSPLGKTISAFQSRLLQLDRQTKFQEESFDEVRTLLENQRDKLDHIPTVNPVLGEHYLSSGYGMRRDPFTGQPRRHYGYDFAARRGTPIRATADGTVIFAGNNGSFGKTIKVDHGNGFVTIYGHCDKILVEKNQQIRRDDVIGNVGNTGRSTGNHLHYEIRQNGRAVSPSRYLLESDKI